ITNQRETTILWSRKTGQPVHPAIVWQDRRTAPQCAALKAQGLEPWFQEKTGLLLDPYFSGTKLAWLLDHVPGAREEALRGGLAFGTVDSWLVWKLTGGRRHVIDVTNASRTLLMNLETQAWDHDLLKSLKIPAEVLPVIVDSSGVLGESDPAWFGVPVPIAGIAGDQQAALFGQLCRDDGMIKNTYGTGCFLLMQTGRERKHSHARLLSTQAWRYGGEARYALEGSVFTAGAAVQWLRDGLKLIPTSAAVEPLAASVPDAGGLVLVPAFTGLGAPYWDPDARGTLLGISRGTTAAHIARATLEGIALQVVDVVEAMQRDAELELKELRVDGGASANNLLMQLQADLLGIPVVRPRNAEATVLGAAYLAGLATGVWRDAEALAGYWAVDRTFTPAASEDWRESMKARWRDAVGRAGGLSSLHTSTEKPGA
ncbi:MAG: glycerol kinase GlpK, partial [Kiritimatiellae bacterium]|nr:glycerol kinase GlpK [Kiritimatiellia bacterium]